VSIALSSSETARGGRAWTLVRQLLLLTLVPAPLLIPDS
jgi:hypothetical protein